MIKTNKQFTLLLMSLFLFVFCMPIQAEASVKQATKDTYITTKVKSKLLSDPKLSGFKIKVKTHDATVHLSGDVTSNENLERAIILANNTSGVKDVQAENLHVAKSTASHPYKDTLITARVRANLLSKRIFTRMNVVFTTIQVETHDGVVTLKGHVESQDQAHQIIKVARNTKGVKKVISHMQAK
jgi:hyperosmotically inducible protein